MGTLIVLPAVVVFAASACLQETLSKTAERSGIVEDVGQVLVVCAFTAVLLQLEEPEEALAAAVVLAAAVLTVVCGQDVLFPADASAWLTAFSTALEGVVVFFVTVLVGQDFTPPEVGTACC